MPIPQTIRINPLDLQKNIAIGVALPFNGPGVFNSTYSTKDQIKSNLINLLLTNKGERIMNPNFGANIKKILFEGMTSQNDDLVKELITTGINTFIPDINLLDISISNDLDTHIMEIAITYSLVISGEQDQIKVQFI